VSFSEVNEVESAHLGDLVIILLGRTLAGLRDRLWDDGFHTAADVVADLTARCDHYLDDHA
jgi:hypothetical protein